MVEKFVNFKCDYLQILFLHNTCSGIECVTSDEIKHDLHDFFFYAEPPFMQSPMEDMERNESMFGRLLCNATGAPLPYVTWYHDGEELAIRGRISQKTSTQLGIWATMSQDTGIYQCFAINEAGATWGAMYYNVIVPGTSVCLSVSLRYHKSQAYTWTLSSLRQVLCWKPCIPMLLVRGMLGCLSVCLCVCVSLPYDIGRPAN